MWWQKFLDSLDTNGGHILLLFFLLVTVLLLWHFSSRPMYERLCDLFSGALLGYLAAKSMKPPIP